MFDADSLCDRPEAMNGRIPGSHAPARKFVQYRCGGHTSLPHPHPVLCFISTSYGKTNCTHTPRHMNILFACTFAWTVPALSLVLA